MPQKELRLTGFASPSPLPKLVHGTSVADRCLSRSRSTVVASVSSRRVLVVNTKGGGHVVIGPHLAEKMLSEGHSVHVHQVGSKKGGAPFDRYDTLSATYPSTFSLSHGDVSSQSVPTGTYDAVYDNNAKSLEDIQPIIEAGKAGAEVFYVSSAGAYSYFPAVAPHRSGDPAKGPTIDVEDALRSNNVSSASFRPIYILGAGSGKREYSDFFFDRIVRNRPLPIPGNAAVCTSITDVRDVCAMLASSLGKGLSGEVMNSVSPRTVTFEGMVQMCAKAAGRTATTVYYDPAEMESKVEGFKVKKAFPFRPRHFFADPYPGKALESTVTWEGPFSGTAAGLQNAVNESYAEYVALGLDKAAVDFSLDDAILAAAGHR